MPTPLADLSGMNSLRLRARAEWLAEPSGEAEVLALLADRKLADLPRTVIGDGTNLVLTGDIPGLVIRPRMTGVRQLYSEGAHMFVEAGAGQRWDALVAFTLARGWQGLENLSLIPGSVGAAPCQNIGAYGVELSDLLVSVTAIDLFSGVTREFSAAECGFGYRDSVFKSGETGRWLITRVRLRLNRVPSLRLEYADLRARFRALPVARQTPAGLRQIICALRREKLPDPGVLPNAGSFFKNPVVDASRHASLLRRFPDLVSYPLPDGRFKLAAGWLIEKAGWKGRREGSLGMHERQALVLVNHGGATGREVLAFATRVATSVREAFAVELEREPVCLPVGSP